MESTRRFECELGQGVAVIATVAGYVEKPERRTNEYPGSDGAFFVDSVTVHQFGRFKRGQAKSNFALADRVVLSELEKDPALLYQHLEN